MVQTTLQSRFSLLRLIRPVLALSLFLTLSSAAFAQRANTVYEFLRIDRSARAAALGGNSVAIAGDINAFFQNPASLSLKTNKAASFSFQKNLLDINAGFAVYGREIRGIGNVAAGISFVNYGGNTAYDETGNETGTFAANDLALQLGISREFALESVGSVTAGASAKLIYSAIDVYRSGGIALDLGVLLTVPTEALTVGFSILNLGSQLNSYDGLREDLPLDVRFSAAKRLEGLPLTLSAGFIQLSDNANTFTDRFTRFTVGLEFIVTDAVLLRFGYNNGRRQDLKTDNSLGLTGLSGGLGIRYDRFQFDYAFSSYGVIGALHQFTVATEL